MTARTWLAVLGTMSAIAAFSPTGCEGKFAGPYPCASGFASCTTSDGCESLILSDGANCGGCGKACSPGAACVNGACGPAPAVLVSTSSPTGITVAGGGVVWASGGNAGGAIERISTGGGTPETLVASGTSVCGAGAPFAIDSTNVYYVTNSNAGGQSASSLVAQKIATCSALGECCPMLGSQQFGNEPCNTTAAAGDVSACATQLAMAQAANLCTGIGQTVLASIGTMNNECVDELALSNGTLYYATNVSATNAGETTSFDSVSTSGGGPHVIASPPSSFGTIGSFVVSGGSLYFPSCGGGCGGLGSVPVTGGSVQYSNGPGGGQAVVTADAENVYMVVGSWNCPNNNNNSNTNNTNDDPGVVIGETTVTAFPLNGGSPTVLASTHDGNQAMGVAVDSSNLYWVTSTMAWSVPLGGGTATAIAGNLWANTATTNSPSSTVPCNSNNSSNDNSSSNSPSIATDGTNIYIADPSNGAIYKIQK